MEIQLLETSLSTNKLEKQLLLQGHELHRLQGRNKWAPASWHGAGDRAGGRGPARDPPGEPRVGAGAGAGAGARVGSWTWASTLDRGGGQSWGRGVRTDMREHLGSSGWSQSWGKDGNQGWSPD